MMLLRMHHIDLAVMIRRPFAWSSAGDIVLDV